jgi:hypothetical protein
MIVTLGNDIDGDGNMDALKAQPGNDTCPGRFDTVLVSHTNIAESTGMQGKIYYIILYI